MSRLTKIYVLKLQSRKQCMSLDDSIVGLSKEKKGSTECVKFKHNYTFFL